jgi:hypothetical protein
MNDEFLHFDTFLEDAERWCNRAEEMRMIAEASRPVANIAGRYIAKRRSEAAQPPANRMSVATAMVARAIPKAAAE